MKVNVSFVISDPDIEDMIEKLGAYRKAIFIREAVREFARTEKGIKLYSRLIKSKTIKKDELNIDDIIGV